MANNNTKFKKDPNTKAISRPANTEPCPLRIKHDNGNKLCELPEGRMIFDNSMKGFEQRNHPVRDYDQRAFLVKQPWTIKDVAWYLRSENRLDYIRELVHRGDLPVLKVVERGKLLFDPDEVMLWVRRHRKGQRT